MTDQERRAAWLGLSRVPGIGPLRTRALIELFGDVLAVWQADAAMLHETGLPTHNVSALLETRQQLDTQAELDKLTRWDARLITWDDDEYPALLRQVPDAPPVLYLRGRLIDADARALAVVGTRKPSHNGTKAAHQIAGQLAAQGVTIISGLAQGIDAAAHSGCLDHGGRTIAFMGTGIDSVYPQGHQKLAQRIADHGALLTEFPPGTSPERHNFPRRNRLMSGIALGVLVVEAPERSGALITARTAGEQGRDVFVIPASYFNATGRGSNRLIQDGAKIVINVEDILDELNISYENVQTAVEAQRIQPANDTEAALLNLLSSDPLHIDDIVRISGLPTAVVSSTLTLLELKGLAQLSGPMQYSLT